jgi:[ribosomal protein S5]-alanine N-acetyltransferase
MYVIGCGLFPGTNARYILDLAATYPARICGNLGHAASAEGAHLPIASTTDRVVARAQLNPRRFVADRRGGPPMGSEHGDVTRPRPTLDDGFVTLRPPRLADKKARLAYGRHPEFVRLDGDDPRLPSAMTPDDVDRWYDLFRADPLRWIVAIDGRCVGFARFKDLQEHDRRAEYAVGLYDPATWGGGIGTAATRLALRHAFETLRLHRVDLRVFTFNTRAIACYERCGFVREGIEREGAWVADAWQSDLIMSILAQEYARLSPGWRAPRAARHDSDVRRDVNRG